MREQEDGETLLARLGARDRASLEAQVEAFIREELPLEGAGRIAYAASIFEERAAALPEPKRRVVLRFAAALRERLGRQHLH
jgi:hypothetical protein